MVSPERVIAEAIRKVPKYGDGPCVQILALENESRPLREAIATAALKALSAAGFRIVRDMAAKSSTEEG